MEDLPNTTGSNMRSFRFSLSLRTKLILSFMLITLTAIIAMGYYIYYRTLQSNALISNQLDSNVRQQALMTLTSAGSEQASDLNTIFTSISRDLTTVSATTTWLLSTERSPDTDIPWDATNFLERNANQSWDNSNSDPGSIFLPSKLELTEPLRSELSSLKQLDNFAPSILKTDPDAIAIYFGGVSGETLYYPNIDLASIVPPDFDVTRRPWYLDAVSPLNPEHKAVWSPPYLDAALHGLVITNSAPVYDSTGNLRGVIAMDIQLKRITDIISNYHFGAAGYALMIDKDKRLIALSSAGFDDFGVDSQTLPQGDVMDQSKLSSLLPQKFFDMLTKMGHGQSGQETMLIAGVERNIVFRPIPVIGYSLAVVVPSQEGLAETALAKEQISEATTNTLQASFVIVAIILMLALLAALWIGNALTSPLRSLTETAEEITEGNLNAEAAVVGRDEIGSLANTLNTMTATLRESIQSLERRVKERTSALEKASVISDRRAKQFETITHVTRAISSIRKMDELMPLIASVISDYFGYYHVGIFLNDEDGQNAFLIAANSEGGHRMLKRNHSLKIGEQGIVGFVAASGETRITRNVGDDIVFFNNPDLPETKSEAAVPLRTGDSIIGVLDVQSINEDAFSLEDINILGILADQVSLAIENSRLFEMTRRSLTETETLYRQYLHEGWSRLPREDKLTGYQYTRRGAVPIQTPGILELKAGDIGKENTAPSSQLSVPIKLRGETIGSLIVNAPAGRPWRQDQVDLVRAVADRVALSAENARLFDETSRRAERERLVSEITSKIRSTNDPEEMVKTALEELRSALGATQIQVIPQVVTAPQNKVNETSFIKERESDAKKRRGNGADT